jgi:hypothetical protein
MWRIGIVVSVVILLVASPALAADFDVTMGSDSGGFRWNINGQLSPTLTLTRGQTYTFAINAPNHPFDIKTAQVTGTASQWTNGVTGEGTTSGTLTFAVPSTAPDQLFYQCEVHGTMTGVVNIVSPATPTPSMGTTLAGGLALLLALVGVSKARTGLAMRRAQ